MNYISMHENYCKSWYRLQKLVSSAKKCSVFSPSLLLHCLWADCSELLLLSTVFTEIQLLVVYYTVAIIACSMFYLLIKNKSNFTLRNYNSICRCGDCYHSLLNQVPELIDTHNKLPEGQLKTDMLKYNNDLIFLLHMLLNGRVVFFMLSCSYDT